MPIDVIMHKMEGRLVPATSYDAELVDSLPLNKDLRCKITVSRSDPHQRWYWKMLSKVVENTEMFATSEALHLFLKVRTGFVDCIKIHTGETVIIPESTSYGSMDQTRFKQYTDAALEVIVTDVLLGTTIDEIMSEVTI
jgi:hypothetical protein